MRDAHQVLEAAGIVGEPVGLHHRQVDEDLRLIHGLRDVVARERRSGGRLDAHPRLVLQREQARAGGLGDAAHPRRLQVFGGRKADHPGAVGDDEVRGPGAPREPGDRGDDFRRRRAGRPAVVDDVRLQEHAFSRESEPVEPAEQGYPFAEHRGRVGPVHQGNQRPAVAREGIGRDRLDGHQRPIRFEEESPPEGARCEGQRRQEGEPEPEPGQQIAACQREKPALRHWSLVTGTSPSRTGPMTTPQPCSSG